MLDSDSTCIDIAFQTPSDEYNWSFGHCQGSDKWLRRGIYIEKCCNLDAQNTLTCSTTSKDGDWSNNFLMMFGHRFCDDLVGQTGIITMNNSGIRVNASNTHTQYLHYSEILQN